MEGVFLSKALLNDGKGRDLGCVLMEEKEQKAKKETR